jgi:hypothetical protein
MAAKNKKNRSLEIRIEIDNLKVSAAPNKRSDDFDRLLRQRKAGSFVFIPLATLTKRGRSSVNNRRLPALKKAKLPEGDWFDGELRSGDDGNAIPGVLAFDIRRRNARKIAETLDVKQFFWGISGAPVEQHAVEVFKDDDGRAWSSVRRRAFGGLTDMLLAARNISTLPTAVHESQTDMQKFWQLFAVVLGAAIGAGALHAIAFALLGSDDSMSWLASVINFLFYPVVIPAVFVGIYLRVLVQKGEAEDRDFAAAEAEENWLKVAPHLLALWGLCYLAVVLLTWLQSVPSTELPFLGRTDGVMTSFVICVWILLPIANSRDVETLFRSGFAAAITAAVSIFTIKLSLYLTNLMTDFLWSLAIKIVPIDIPAWLQATINAFINVGAELFFMAVLLGYTWSRTRQQFMRL